MRHARAPQPGDVAVTTLHAGNPLGPKEGFCPKCVTPKREASRACFACGLEFEKFQASVVAPPPWLAEKWMEVWNDFGNKEKHHALLAQAQLTGDVAALARLYKVAGTWKNEPQTISTALERIQNLTVQSFLATAESAQTATRLRKLKDKLLIVASAAVLLMVAWALKQLLSAL